MNIFKKFGAASYVSAAAFILALAGLITVCVSNAIPGYGLDNFGTGIALAAVALVAIALVVASGLKLGGQSPLTAVLRVAAVLLAMFAAGVIIYGSVVLTSPLMPFDSNEGGWAGFNTSLNAHTFIVVSRHPG